MPLSYLPINKEALPYEFNIKLAEETFIFTINYNLEHDFFTVDLAKGDETLALGEKIVYGRPLFSAYADDRFPKVAIIAYDIAGQESIASTVNWENLMISVFLYILTPEEFADVETV